MLGYVVLAVLNGVVIGISRSVNGRLSIDLGPFKASLWNHVVGFVFLVAVMVGMGDSNFDVPRDAPAPAYVGGFVGALFVAVNSYVLPRIGVAKTALLVIGGQMITGVLIDHRSRGAVSTVAQFVGVAIIVLGVYVARTADSRRPGAGK